jgi:hypothetical protein
MKSSVLEKSLTEEKKTGVESTAEAAPFVLSQAPPISSSDPKPVVDKASSVVAHPLDKK